MKIFVAGIKGVLRDFTGTFTLAVERGRSGLRRGDRWGSGQRTQEARSQGR